MITFDLLDTHNSDTRCHISEVTPLLDMAPDSAIINWGDSQL